MFKAQMSPEELRELYYYYPSLKKITETNDKIVAEIQSLLECPVCLTIPRDLPIPSCPSGHIVCQTCRSKVLNCPTCRQKMSKRNRNTLAGSIIEQMEHMCRHDGCEMKLKLQKIKIHEQHCPHEFINLTTSGINKERTLKTVNFKIRRTTPLYELKRKYSDTIGAPLRSLKFLFNGNIIKDEDSCMKHGLNQDDTIGVVRLEDKKTKKKKVVYPSEISKLDKTYARIHC